MFVYLGLIIGPICLGPKTKNISNNYPPIPFIQGTWVREISYLSREYHFNTSTIEYGCQSDVCCSIGECLAIVNACLEKRAHYFTLCKMFVWSIWAISGFSLYQHASPFHFFCQSSPFEDLFKKSYPFVMITPHVSSFPWFTSCASQLCSARAFTSCNVSDF